MNILVTGGAGFIGSNFIMYILNKYPGYKIINIDKLSYAADLSYLDSIKNNPNYKFYHSDISNRSQIEEIFREEDIQYIVNFAAESHVDRSIIDSTPFVVSNVLGTQVLLDLSLKYNIEIFLQVSTDEVYGHLELKEKKQFNELNKLDPRSPYSASKASADLIAMSYFSTHGLPVKITRCSNNFGPHQCKEKFIPTCINSVINNKKIPIYGDGQYVRDWLYVEDHCIAIDSVLHKGRMGEIYNIGANNEWANIDIAKYIIKLMGASDNLIEFVNDRPGHDRRYSIDTNKIFSELKWEAKYNFHDQMLKTIEWYKNI